jgi:ATP-binding cassette, subfamily F, member 3
MLKFTDLSLRRGPRLLLENVTLQIHPGQKAGVTGANGSGKSSLFSLVLGELGPDAGDIAFPADWVVAHVAQETPTDRRASIEYVLDGDAELRNVERQIAAAEAGGSGERLANLHARFEAIDGYTARSRAGQLLHGLGFTTEDESRAVNEFSGGWRMRLNLARALMSRSSLLLLDEPTNHLDLDAVIWLEGWLRAYRGTLLLISHDRDFLDAVVDRIVHLEHRTATLYTGNYSAFERVRAERLAHQRAQFEKQQREVAHMQAFIERFRAKASKARQAQSRIKALERMQVILPAHVDSPFHFSLRQPLKTPNPLLRLDEVAAGYGEQTVLSGVRLTLSPGDRIGLLGPNGAGKSTLVKLLAGLLPAQQGEYAAASDLVVGYFAQHQVDQLDPSRSPLEHLTELDPDARELELRTWLGGFGFSGDTVFRPTAPFSGGEKSRLALALLVYRRPNLLLLDEPTNHLDIEMRQALANALQSFTGAMVIVSHDRHLLRVTSDRLLLVNAGAVAEFDGSLDDYPAWLARRLRAEPPPERRGEGERGEGERGPAERGTDAKARRRRDAAQREALRPLNRRVEKAEKALARLQAERTALEERLADSTLYEAANRDELSVILDRQADNRWALAKEEAAWLEACEELEKMQVALEEGRGADEGAPQVGNSSRYDA